MTKLLSDRIKELHLRPNAPYPSQVTDARDFIRRFRESQRLQLVVDPVSDRDFDDNDDYTDPEAA